MKSGNESKWRPYIGAVKYCQRCVIRTATWQKRSSKGSNQVACDSCKEQTTTSQYSKPKGEGGNTDGKT